MSPFEYSQATLDWIKACEERELESQEKRASKTEDDYIKFLDILQENLEGFYYYHLPGSYHGKETKFYYWYYEDSDEIVVYNSANDLNNDFTTARELVEDICNYLLEKVND